MDQFLDQDVDDIGQFGFRAGGFGGHGAQPATGLCVDGANVDELAQAFMMAGFAARAVIARE